MRQTGRKRRWYPGRAAVAAVVVALPVWAVPGVASASDEQHRNQPAFTEVDLVSNVPDLAAVPDDHVKNAWGLALGPTTPLWVANNGTDTATIYRGGLGGAPPTIAPLVVSVQGGPTGQAFNGTSDFAVSGPLGSGPALFLFVTEGGDVLGWSPAADGTHALLGRHVEGAIYKGLALASTPFGNFLLAADFHNGRIDVFDKEFNRIQLPQPFFTDRRLPSGYAPFNVAVRDGEVYVAYAQQDADAKDEVAGPGKGFVDVFNGFGLLERRLVSHGPLNAPWGLEIAPASFGDFAGDLLVGNFGDGRITAVNRRTGHVDGQLSDVHGRPIEIDGLWALLRGTATTGGTDAVWFSAGPNDEANGLVGQIRPATG
jgi:uncharacterized protein (TIGR03118 family)